MTETNNISISGDTVIGDIVDHIPGAMAVIEKYFGNGCFTCPGIRMETINFGSTMHGVNAETVVADIKSLVQ